MRNEESSTLVLGAVAYDPKVVTIWEGFKVYFVKRRLPFDYVLYSNYERQVEALFDGTIDVAWNSPLAWLRAERIGRATNRPVHAVLMRDTDCDLRSVILVRAESGIRNVPELNGKRLGVGAIDSPQATLIPLEMLRREGVSADSMTVVRFDVLAGKHGDHVGGERDAVKALLAGDVDAACLIEGNLAVFEREALVPAGALRRLAATPTFDHCNFTVGPAASRRLVDRFREILLGMSYDDPEVRPLFDLEGLTAWREGRTSEYSILDAAVDTLRFYDPSGAIIEPRYEY